MNAGLALSWHKWCNYITSIFERKLALLVALQGESIWKGSVRRQLEDNSLKLLSGLSVRVVQVQGIYEFREDLAGSSLFLGSSSLCQGIPFQKLYYNCFSLFD